MISRTSLLAKLMLWCLVTLTSALALSVYTDATPTVTRVHNTHVESYEPEPYTHSVHTNTNTNTVKLSTTQAPVPVYPIAKVPNDDNDDDDNDAGKYEATEEIKTKTSVPMIPMTKPADDDNDAGKNEATEEIGATPVKPSTMTKSSTQAASTTSNVSLDFDRIKERASANAMRLQPQDSAEVIGLGSIVPLLAVLITAAAIVFRKYQNRCEHQEKLAARQAAEKAHADILRDPTPVELEARDMGLGYSPR
jgi:hypothetical protein